MNYKITYAIFSVLMVLLVSVAATWWITRNYYDHTKETDSAFRLLDSNLVEANEIHRSISREDSFEMANNLKFLERREKAEMWMPFINRAIALNTSVQIYLESVKQRLKEEAGIEAFDGKEDSNTNHSNYNMNSEERRRLFDSLTAFANNVAVILPETKRGIIKKLPIQSTLASFKNANEWCNHYFKGLSVYGIIARLTKFENDAFRSINQVTEVIRYQIAVHPIVYDVFDVLIGQNTTCLLPGQTLEVTAGLGMYSNIQKPFIVINGIKQELNAYGVAVYKKQITVGKDGSIPVTVSFKDPTTGESKSKTTTIYYTIFRPPVK